MYRRFPTRTAWESAPREPRNSIPVAGPAPAAVPVGAAAVAGAMSCLEVEQAARARARSGRRRGESIEASSFLGRVGGRAMLPPHMPSFKGWRLRTEYKQQGKGGMKGGTARATC